MKRIALLLSFACAACARSGSTTPTTRVTQSLPSDVRQVPSGLAVSGVFHFTETRPSAVTSFQTWFILHAGADGVDRIERGRGEGNIIPLARNIDGEGAGFFFDRGAAALFRGSPTKVTAIALPCSKAFPPMGVVSGTSFLLAFAGCDTDPGTRLLFIGPDQATAAQASLGEAAPSLLTSNELNVALYTAAKQGAEVRIFTANGELRRLYQRGDEAPPTLAALALDSRLYATVPIGDTLALRTTDDAGIETTIATLAGDRAPVALATSTSGGVFVLTRQKHAVHFAKDGAVTADFVIEDGGAAKPLAFSVRIDGTLDVAGTLDERTIVTWTVDKTGAVTARREIDLFAE